MKPTRGIELALVPLDLGHHPTGSGPAGGLVVEAGVRHDRLLGRPSDRPGQQVADPTLQHLVGREPDRVADVLRLQQLVDLWLGERRIGAEVEIDAPLAVAGDHRLQHQAPVLGAMDVARSQETALQVAVLIEHEQRVIARAAEVAVPGRALLLAMGRALGAVHVENDAFGRLPCMHPVDPGSGQVHERLQVGVGRQPLGLEAPDLAARSGRTIEPVTANDRPHRGVAGEPLGIVDILVAGEPTEHRLAEQPAQLVAGVLATAAVEELRGRHVGEPEGIIELAVGEQPAVRGDLGAVEFELDPAVEGGPQRQLFGFTRHVPQDRPAHLTLTS